MEFTFMLFNAIFLLSMPGGSEWILILLVILLFFGGKTVLKKEKNAEMTHTAVESISFEDYEAQQIKKLMPSEVEQVNLLKSSLKSLQETDTTARKKILHQLSDFWKNLDNHVNHIR